MTETRPHLEVVEREGVVPEGGAAAAKPTPETPPAEGGRPLDRKLWIAAAVLVAGLLICAGGWLAQAQEGARLERSLAASEAALSATRADLARAQGRLTAFEGHLSGAQDRLGSIRAEIGALADFLSAGPEADPQP